MLEHIHIKDFAIIENLDLDFHHGMTVITGETGAGKSIVIDALDIALGERADNSLIRHNANSSEISLTFNVKNIPAAKTWLTEKELDCENECIIRRIISNDSRSRNYLNGRPVTLQQIKELGGLLIHVHAQHQHHALLKKDEQRNLLDNYAGHAKLTQRTAQIHQQWQQLQKQIQAIQGNDAGKIAQRELLHYQVQELEQLNLAGNEVESLHQEQEQLANAEQFITFCQQGLLMLDEDNSANCSSLLSHVKQNVTQLSNFPEQQKNILQLIQDALINCEEAASELRQLQSGMTIDPVRLQKIDARLTLIHDLARKHQVKAGELLIKQKDLQSKLHDLEHADEKLADLLQQQNTLEQTYAKVAKQLTNNRNKFAKKLSQLVTQSMRLLGMNKGQFSIALHTEPASRPHPFGADEVEFLVCANPGQPLKSLSKVASGGELSRISLAVQVISAQREATPSLVFDEVDVGIGGGTAEIVGQLLRKLGQSAQVLCITHLPQVAAQGHYHLSINKQQDSNETQQQVTLLNEKQRVEEIARMLGGIKITTQTRAHAKQMLTNVSEETELTATA